MRTLLIQDQPHERLNGLLNFFNNSIILISIIVVVIGVLVYLFWKYFKDKHF